MANFARIINNVAVDVSATPHTHYHPELAVAFEPVPDEVRANWVIEDGQWVAPKIVEPLPVPVPVPVPVPEPAPSYPTVGPIHFKMLFTAPERLKAKELRGADLMLDDFWELIDDPRTDVVNLALQSVQQAVEYTLAAVDAAGVAVDVPERKAAILTGQLL